MPLYEYHCRECGAKFEKLVRFGSGSGDMTCPTCNSSAVEKVMSVFGTVRGTMGFPVGGSAAGGSCGPVG